MRGGSMSSERGGSAGALSGSATPSGSVSGRSASGLASLGDAPPAAPGTERLVHMHAKAALRRLLECLGGGEGGVDPRGGGWADELASLERSVRARLANLDGASDTRRERPPPLPGLVERAVQCELLAALQAGLCPSANMSSLGAKRPAAARGGAPPVAKAPRR